MARVIAALALLGASLAGCAAGAIQRPYSEQELRERCERQGGWWHPDELMGGFCEYQSPGMVLLE